MFRLTLGHVERYPESPSQNSSSEVLKVSAIKRQSSNNHHIQHNSKTLLMKRGRREWKGKEGGGRETEREGWRERERGERERERSKSGARMSRYTRKSI